MYVIRLINKKENCKHFYFKKLESQAVLMPINDADTFKREGSARASLRSALEYPTHKFPYKMEDFEIKEVTLSVIE